MDRHQIASILEECGILLELKGENPFRANSYKNGARAIEQFDGDLEAAVRDDTLKGIKGIGDTLATKIKEMVTTGKLAFHEKLKAEVPAGLIDVIQLHGVGPKKAAQLYKDVGIESIEQLKEACLTGKLNDLKGFGKKTVQNILNAIEFKDTSGKRVLFPVAWQQATDLRDYVQASGHIERIEICGSLRRRRETVADIDILASSTEADKVMQRFVTYPQVREVLGHGATKSSILLTSGMQADLRVVTDTQFPFAQHYFTGSKAHNVAMRARAQDLGLKLNEYELAGKSGSIACTTEADIFAALGLQYVPPELREDTGEFKAAQANELPTLIEFADLQGTFHCHTTDSDGKGTLAEMVHAAKVRGLKYFGLGDHSVSAFYANGLTAERVADQHKRIDSLQKKMTDLKIYKGIESDILADGSLDYPPEVLATFDYVVASIHSQLTMTRDAMTQRIINAIRNPYTTMIGHLTGRLLLQRAGYDLDIEAILQEAAKHQVMIEINAHPVRLDLDWVHCKRAKALGVLIVINPDAHNEDGISDIMYGVNVARRGWLEKGDVFNTRSVREVDKYFAERKKKHRAPV